MMSDTDKAEEPIERLVYFFLPLPEPLQLPDNHRVETLDAMSSTDLRRAHREYDWHPEGGTGYLVASSRIWQTTVPRAAHLGPILHATREVAYRAVPTLNHLVGTEDMPSTDDEETVPRTVVEVAVRVAEFDDQAGGAFEVAVECVQAIQRAHYLVGRRPLTLLTVENAPFAVLMARREARPSDGPSGGWPDELDVYMPNTNVQEIAAEPEWGEDKVHQFGDVIAVRQVAPFIPMAQLIEEGRHALRRRGDYRTAVTLLYSASEVMFDTLLMHMLWEENKSPEAAASECFSDAGLQTRLKAHYASRLRGNWHFDREGPLSAWNRYLASIRHRIVHSGYTPSRDEAYRASSAFDSLHAFITDRVTIGQFIRRYPITAMSLMGVGGLKAHGRWTKWLERLVSDPREVEWPTTFGRWKVWLDTLRDVAESVAVEDDDCMPVLLFETEKDDTWWLHDTVSHLVIQTETPSDITDEAKTLHAQQREEFIEQAQLGDRGSLAWFGASGSPLPGAEWTPEYEVLPFHGIMRDGSDVHVSHRM